MSGCRSGALSKLQVDLAQVLQVIDVSPTRQLDEMEKIADRHVWNSQLVQSGVQIN